MKSAQEFAFAFTLLALLSLGLAAPMLAQDQINLTDGHKEIHWNGIGSTHISMTIPSPYCSGGTCIFAQASASGTGNLASSGTYTVSSAATTRRYRRLGWPDISDHPGGRKLSRNPDAADPVRLHLSRRHADRSAEFYDDVGIR